MCSLTGKCVTVCQNIKTMFYKKILQFWSKEGAQTRAYKIETKSCLFQ